MALLDFLRNFEERTGRRIEENIGGLLGEDISKLPDAERKAIRRQARMRAFETLANLGSQSEAMRGVAEDVGKRLEARRTKERIAAAEAALPDLASLILGGRTGTMIEDVQGGAATPLTARRAPSVAGSREALQRMYATQSGRDVAAIAPGLFKAAEEATAPTDYVFQSVPGVGLVAVNRKDPTDRRVIQREVQRPERVQPTLRQVRLANGMVQDMWIAPGQAQGVKVGAPYAPKGAEAAGEPLNERQRAGVSMTRDAALQYASNLTGLSKQDLAGMSPNEIEQEIKKRGGRVLQGGVARTAVGLPVVGDLARTIVEAANADLIGPATSGGSGIAMLQNPTGPITGTDVEVGIRQFPNPMLPVDVQAQMIRSILERDGRLEQYDANGNRVR